MVNKGFTLIELLVVIAIIAVLLSIIVVAIDPVQRIREAQDQAAASNVQLTGSVVGACVTDFLVQSPLPDYEDCALPGTIIAYGKIPSTVRLEPGDAPVTNDVCTAEQGSLGIVGHYYAYSYSTGTVRRETGDLAAIPIVDWCP